MALFWSLQTLRSQGNLRSHKIEMLHQRRWWYWWQCNGMVMMMMRIMQLSPLCIYADTVAPKEWPTKKTWRRSQRLRKMNLDDCSVQSNYYDVWRLINSDGPIFLIVKFFIKIFLFLVFFIIIIMVTARCLQTSRLLEDPNIISWK